MWEFKYQISTKFFFSQDTIQKRQESQGFWFKTPRENRTDKVYWKPTLNINQTKIKDTCIDKLIIYQKRQHCVFWNCAQHQGPILFLTLLLILTIQNQSKRLRFWIWIGLMFNKVGDIFLKSVYVVFDQKNVQIGFAQRTPTSTG